MQQSINKDRFIPLRKSELVNACLAHQDLHEKVEFGELCSLIVSTLHFEYHQHLEVLKDNYAPFDPNSDTLKLNPLSQSELTEKQAIFANTFAKILNAANFEKVTDQDLREALEEESLFKVRLAVEFDDFAEVVFYRRGEYQKTEIVKKWWGLKKQKITFTNYDKVAVYIRFKDKDYFEAQDRETDNFEPSSTIIKLFQNVPKADLEMLFPNSEVRMRTLDKAIIGGSALIGGTIMLVTKLGASLLLVSGLLAYWIGLSDKEVTITTKELLALAAGAGVLGGFIFKEWSKFKNRKLKFMKALADNLYFKNLDNNAGVFHHLLDSAEEEECKEAILAYFFLHISKTPHTALELDRVIEQWFEDTFNFEIDFEIEDALSKLTRFGIIKKREDKYEALNLAEAKAALDEKWDNIF
jgi:arsenate reductase-like glutaredoxin family protein